MYVIQKNVGKGIVRRRQYAIANNVSQYLFQCHPIVFPDFKTYLMILACTISKHFLFRKTAENQSNSFHKKEAINILPYKVKNKKW